MKKKSYSSVVLVTGGPTRAYLDRVRYLSNFSTGQVAYELCRALEKKGFEVVLISGPCAQPFEKLRLKAWFPVETTEEMHAVVMRACRKFHPGYAIFSAAVLDFTPARFQEGKVSSRKKKWTLELKPTPKIIDEVGRRFPKIARVGFKLEWKRTTAKAARALAEKTVREKKLEALCLNFLSEIAGTQHPALLVSHEGESARVESKVGIARWIADHLKRKDALNEVF